MNRTINPTRWQLAVVLLSILGAAGAITACGPDSQDAATDTGGTVGTGGSGATASGGVSASGGAPSAGGQASTGGQPTGGAGGTGGTGGTGGADDCGLSGLAPNDVVYLMPAGSPEPAATGGAVVAGTYELTAWNYDGSVLPASRAGASRATLLVFTQDGSGQLAQLEGSSNARSTFVWETIQTFIQFTYDCPAGLAVSAMPYSAVGNELRLYADDTELVLTRR